MCYSLIGGPTSKPLLLSRGFLVLCRRTLIISYIFEIVLVVALIIQVFVTILLLFTSFSLSLTDVFCRVHSMGSRPNSYF